MKTCFKINIIPLLLSVILIVFLSLPSLAVSDNYDECQEDPATYVIDDFSVKFSISNDGEVSDETTVYFYEDYVDDEGNIHLSASTDPSDVTRAQLFWSVMMEQSSFDPQTYKPMVAIGQMGNDTVKYAECKLDMGDGTYSWASYKGTTSQFVYITYPYKYYPAGTYTISAVSASAEFQQDGWVYYPGTGFQEIYVDPITINVE